jgi:hypothetical protein
MIIGSALATNAHRIQRYLVAKIKLENAQKKASQGQERSQEVDSVAFFASLNAIFEAGLALLGLRKRCLVSYKLDLCRESTENSTGRYRQV